MRTLARWKLPLSRTSSAAWSRGAEAWGPAMVAGAATRGAWLNSPASSTPSSSTLSGTVCSSPRRCGRPAPLPRGWWRLGGGKDMGTAGTAQSGGD